jgi:hypothetical protein
LSSKEESDDETLVSVTPPTLDPYILQFFWFSSVVSVDHAECLEKAHITSDIGVDLSS